MRTFEIHEARDGRRFDQAADCEKYEALMGRVDAVMEMLPPKPDSCEFSNGGGYIQHTALTAQAVQLGLVDIAKEVAPWAAEKCGDADAHISWWLRMLDGTCPYLGRAMGRLYCMDDRSREWGQPYYALHPSEGTQREWPRAEAAR